MCSEKLKVVRYLMQLFLEAGYMFGFFFFQSLHARRKPNVLSHLDFASHSLFLLMTLCSGSRLSHTVSAPVTSIHRAWLAFILFSLRALQCSFYTPSYAPLQQRRSGLSWDKQKSGDKKGKWKWNIEMPTSHRTFFWAIFQSFAEVEKNPFSELWWAVIQ